DVGLRGLVEAADLADVLERRVAHFLVGGGRLEVEERVDVSAHAAILALASNPTAHRGGLSTANGSVTSSSGRRNRNTSAGRPPVRAPPRPPPAPGGRTRPPPPSPPPVRPGSRFEPVRSRTPRRSRTRWRLVAERS